MVLVIFTPAQPKSTILEVVCFAALTGEDAAASMCKGSFLGGAGQVLQVFYCGLVDVAIVSWGHNKRGQGGGVLEQVHGRWGSVL
jgi:hypothetical protein